MTWIWGLVAAAALVWPDHVASALDGAPLDRPAEAIVIGLLVPTLWWLHPRFLGTRVARALIAALVVMKIVTGTAFVQEGFCVRFEPQRPYVRDQTGAPHAWDVRADWRAPDPACSAIMTRPYEIYWEFPVWFYNLPPPDDGWPVPTDYPPEATTRMTVRGYVSPTRAGTLRIDTSPSMAAAVSVDGHQIAGAAPLDAGTHMLFVDAVLLGTQWALVPTWDGDILWRRSSLVATTKRPTDADVRWRSLARYATVCIIGALATVWSVSAIATIADTWVLGWTTLMSALIAFLVLSGQANAARWSVAALAFAAALPVPTRLKNLRGAGLLVGVPWLAFVAATAAPGASWFVLHEWGNDFWTFQRAAYRIVMQGYWLEGGSATFWFQPLYRWIAGLLHVAFGDSKVGESFWDGACLLAMALVAFRIVRERAGFRWGIIAAALPLAIFVLGTPQYLIGRGLGEITSAGFLSAAALWAMRSRHGDAGAALAAGLFATLAFYTRLNNLPMAFGVALFAWRRRHWRSSLVIAGTVIVGMLLFAWRTWHYTGVFSLFYGTQRDYLAIWRAGVSIRDGLARTIDSVLMVLTVNDPPRFDPFALPVVAGAAAAVLAALRVRPFTRIAIAPVLFFFSGIVGAFVARGSAYPGRFSMHILPIACAILVSAAASVSSKGIGRA